MDNQEANAPVLPVEFDIFLSKNAVGAELYGQEFEFSLYNNQGVLRATARNDSSGLVIFHMTFSAPGVYNYSVKETESPHGWDTDDKEYPVIFEIGEDTELHKLYVANVDYPDGLPGFINKLEGEKCRLIEFPELEFDEPGVYEFTLKELTTSGGGWTTDSREIKVIVRVIDDGFGHLVATVEYPDGFPEFTNKYKAKPAHIIISACKIAVGAELPKGRFEFGLYDSEGKLVSTARNN